MAMQGSVRAACVSGETIPVGTLVGSRYRVLCDLGGTGRGHMAVAWDERATGPPQLVTLEALSREQPLPAPEHHPFSTESRLRVEMSHPNVLQVHGAIHHGELPVVVLEYLDGETLATLLALGFGKPEFSLEMRLEILVQALRGLGHVHSHCDASGRPSQLVHGSFSPHNIVMTYAGSVKLAGVSGLARRSRQGRSRSAGVRERIIQDELEYLAPEQLRGDPSAPADVFAAGIVLWELVAQQRFWARVPQVAIERRLATHDIPDISHLKPFVGGELARICRKALAPDPARRYGSATDLLRDLERYLVERGGRVAPTAIGTLMENTCGHLRREARQVLDSALAVSGREASQRGELPSEPGVWNFRKRQRSLPGSAAGWVVGLLGAVLIAIAVRSIRPTASAPVSVKPLAAEGVRVSPSNAARVVESPTLIPVLPPPGQVAPRAARAAALPESGSWVSSKARALEPKRSTELDLKNAPGVPSREEERTESPRTAAPLETLARPERTGRDDPAMSIRLER